MRKSTALGLCLLSAMVVILAVVLTSRRPTHVESAPSSQPSTAPASRPATEPATRPTEPLTDFSKYLVAMEPRLVDSPRQRSPVSLDVAAGVVSQYPVHLDLRGDLWITHPDAPPAEQILQTTGDQQVHLTRDRVVFVFWARDPRGRWVPRPVVRDGQRYSLLTPNGPLPLARTDYRWEDAVLLRDDRLVVPTDDGVAVLMVGLLADVGEGRTTRPAAGLTEQFTSIATGKTPVRVFAVRGGAVAFRAWDNGDRGSDEVLYLGPRAWGEAVGDGFVPLAAETDFPPQPIHVFPLTDGSNLVLSVGEDGGVRLSTVAPLDVEIRDDPERDARIHELIEQLNDPKAPVRSQAQADLARFGPSAWPILEGVLEAQTPEAQGLIRSILGLRASPALGIFVLLPGPVRMVSRGSDGSLALYTYGGVAWYENGEDQLKSPALLYSRPGRRTQLVHDSVLKDRKPDTLELQLRYDDLLVNDAVRGPLRLMGNHVAPLLREEHKPFSRWIGVDRAGRWLFTSPDADRWLLLDPNYLDPTPRLPAWVIPLSEGRTGWDDAGHAVIERGGSPWRLERAGWQPMGKDAVVRYEPHEVQASGSASVWSVEGSLVGLGATRPNLLRQPEAPPLAVLRTSPDTVFLFDHPGRVVRLSKNKTDGTFEPDATFTEFIPSTGVRRIWLDPFGRICIAHDRNKLTLLFPEGRIPADLQNLARTPRRKP